MKRQHQIFNFFDYVLRAGQSVDSRVDPYTFTFSQNSAGRVRLSSGCFPRQRRRRGAARAEGDSDVPEKAEALQEARPRREGRDRAGAGQEPAGPRDGARPGEVPVERRRRGQAQPHRHARAGQGVEGRVGARGRLRQAPRLAARLQRLQQAPLPLLDAVPLRVLRGPRPAAGRRRAVRRQARGGPHGGGVRVHRRQDQGRPGPRPVAGADSRRPLVRVQGRPLHHLPLDRAGLRRHVQHGPAPQGGVQAEEEGGARADAARPGALLLGVLGAPGGRARGRLRDGHGDRARRRPAVRPHAPPALLPRAAVPAFAREVVERGGGRARRAGGGRREEGVPAHVRAGPHRQRRGVLGLGVPGEVVPAGQGGPLQSLLLRRAPVPAEGGLRAQPRRAAEAPAQAARHIIRRPGGRRHGGRHVPAQLRAEALDGVHAPAAGAPGRLRRRRRRAHGRAGRRGGALRRAAARRRGRQPRPAGEGGRIR